MTIKPETQIERSILCEARQLDDAALVEEMLRRDEDAWREFVRRHEPVLRQRIQGALRRMTQALGSDAVDDVVGDFHLRLIERDMRPLRDWFGGSRRIPLDAWLWMIASALLNNHLRRALNEEATIDNAEALGVFDHAGACDSAGHRVGVPRLSITDDRTNLTFVWFGDAAVIVFDEDGKQVLHYPVGTNAKSLKRSTVERAIRRLIARLARANMTAKLIRK